MIAMHAGTGFQPPVYNLCSNRKGNKSDHSSPDMRRVALVLGRISILNI